MVHADKIHKWLSEPDTFAAADTAALMALVEKYPYFVPGRYLQVIEAGKATAFSSDTLSRMYLFMGDWLLYHRMMQEEEVVVTTQTPAEPTVEKVMPGITDRGILETVALGGDENVLNTETLIAPVYTEDYFLHQGVRVSEALPQEADAVTAGEQSDDDKKDKSLMVVMSFSEWLSYFKSRSEKERQEADGRKALKSMWQKEKLAAALEDETDEIPDNVFNMAVNSISREEDIASESLAEVLVRQGKHDKAIDMYRKLSLRNPKKNAYFAARIEKIQKEKRT